MRRPTALVASLFVTVGVVLACTDTTAAIANPAAPRVTFAVIGCNRVDAADTLGDTSTANVEELTRTFQDIAALPVKPRFLFFTGDLVFGYTPDTLQLDRELRAWRTLYEASPLPALGVELVAMPGNHEMQNLSKVATAAAERTWLRDMQPYIMRGGNGPTAGGPDNLATDQSKLTYSFDYAGSHFVTINTDPTGADW
ncbi:MAG TPA: metallophosphoesterase family protein, partial [Gemmatirosa sp.]